MLIHSQTSTLVNKCKTESKITKKNILHYTKLIKQLLFFIKIIYNKNNTIP